MSQHQRPPPHPQLYSSYSSPSTVQAPSSPHDDLLTPMQQLSVQEPDPSYLFQPFIPYSTPGMPPYYHPQLASYPASPNPNSPGMPTGMWTSPPVSPAMGMDARQRDPQFAMYQHSPWSMQHGLAGPPYQPQYGSYQQHHLHPGSQTHHAQQQHQQQQWAPRNGPHASNPPPGPSLQRKSYHPQPPANRSEWVMWVGNVPSNATHEELWKFFNTDLGNMYRGPSSIFLISRSSCAFVNLTSEADLQHAVANFNGRALRPWDPRCPRLVCRIRKKDDDLRSGVGAQRGTGIHRQWVQSQAPQSPVAPADPPTPEKENSDDTKHRSSASYASTNSSFLTRHFPMRIFILKSATITELEESVKTGTWRTQRHNEPVLDQAFRTSADVFLIFGANKSGEFFGYAKMVEHIDKEKAKKYSNEKYSSKSSARFSKISEEATDRPRGGSEPVRPSYFLSQSQSHIQATSPGEITPGDDFRTSVDGRSATDPAGWKRAASPTGRAQTLDPKKVQPNYFPPVPIPAQSTADEADRQQALGGSMRDAKEDDGVLRKDTALMPDEKPAREQEENGRSFKIQWLKTAPISFSQTRHLRNPWNADREVKVSRDGTELEPGIGTQLMALWDDAKGP